MEGQRAIVAVKWGPLQGQKAILEPGTAKRFGRAEWADFVVPHDRQMSGVHFEVAWDGAAVRVRDLASVTGTLIDGEPGRREGIVESGSWLKAGETVFTVHIERATPPRDVDNRGVWTKLFSFADGSVVKTRTEHDEQIRLFEDVIGKTRTVHTQHAQ